MIQANELRIGNLIYFKSKLNGKRKKICTVLAGDIGRCNLIHEEYFPIRFTPKILFAAGFKEDMQSCLRPTVRTFYLPVPVKREDGTLIENDYLLTAQLLQGNINSGYVRFSVNDYCASVNIYYLHRLQNFYFEATGEELPLNFEK